MINRNTYRAALIIVSLLFSLFIAAQNKTTVKATVDRSQILIGERISLKLEADIPGNQPILFLGVDSLPHFDILQKNKVDTSNTNDGTILSQLILITSFDSGHWVIPSFTLTGKITTDTLPVDVGFSPFNPEQSYHDIKDIIEVTPEEKKKEWWWYIAAGAFLLLIILFLLFRKKKKPVVKESKSPVDPYKEAMLQLEKLQKEKPDTKQYYSRLVDIFRVYVFTKKAIHSFQKTTDDLVMQLRSLDMPKEQFEKLSQSLRLSDFVKFAKYIPSAEDDKSVFDEIRNSIINIEKSGAGSPSFGGS